MGQPILDKTNKTVGSDKSRKKSGGKIFTILFLIVFVLGFGALGTGMVYSAYKKEKTYNAVTEGKVAGYRDYSYSYKHKFSPLVEYWVGNQVFMGETNIRFNYQPFKVGEYVSVYYNPKKPDEFYIKKYDLKTTYGMGAIFLLVSIGALGVFILFTILGKVKMDKEKKEQMQVKIILSLIFLFMFIVFSFVAGFGITICIFAGIGLFALYGLHQNKNK